MCILQERFDPSSKAKLWALPRTELCLCRGVVAPQFVSSESCPKRIDALEDIWFTDDYTLVTRLTNIRNWTPSQLDHLLGRSQCCKFWLLVHVPVVSLIVITAPL